MTEGFRSGMQILLLYCTTQLVILHSVYCTTDGQAASPPPYNLDIAGTVRVTNETLSALIVW